MLKSTASPEIVIIGRSQSKFASTLTQLEHLNPSAKLTFIEAQVSLLKEVDRACATIKAQRSTLDLLWLSQGGLSQDGHKPTAEGPIDDFAIKYYSRVLFMRELMPLLTKSSGPRVVSVLSAGQEGPVNMDDIGLSQPENYRFWSAARQGVTMMSLAMREMARQNPSVTFIHTNPGMVSTAVHQKWAESMTGYWTPVRWLMHWLLIPLMHSFGITAEEAGEIGLYELTDVRYAATTGTNFYRLNEKADDESTLTILSEYAEDGTQKRVWEHTVGVFDQVLAQ